MIGLPRRLVTGLIQSPFLLGAVSFSATAALMLARGGAIS